MRRRRGFTLVELLVVIAIIGMLVALLLPAIQAARESARMTQCRNHLKQMAMGFLNHESSHGHLPSSGWGWRWVGDPEGGYGKDQPGGWAYNILEYIEQGRLRQLTDGNPMNMRLREGVVEAVSTPVPIFNCPTRRPAQLYPLTRFDSLAYNMFSCKREDGCEVVRGDYQVNSGSRFLYSGPGPTWSVNPATYNGWIEDLQNSHRIDGISYQRSMVRIAQITDGTSQTYMLGERYLDPNHYFTGEKSNDDQCVFVGHDRDVNGYTGYSSGTRAIIPRADTPGVGGGDLDFMFGSAHQPGFNMAYCDGSVHFVSYDIDEIVYLGRGSRNARDRLN